MQSYNIYVHVQAEHCFYKLISNLITKILNIYMENTNT